ncbi:MAG: cation:proton antiporter [Bacteroidales bacterium]|nr:cation:proton antiporter [Bacteroidales bacterium]MDD4821150.1 cation:proton antiporter [Bacteroidales bacterium]
MHNIDLTFPITDPILIFLIVLAIILFIPLLLNRLRVPYIIGMILAGMFIGPKGFGLLLRDSSFEIFGKVGMLYILFLPGIEMALSDLKKNISKSVTFGLYTFGSAMIIGVLVSYYLMHMSLLASVLLGTMYAEHTLIAYPIVSRFGVVKNLSVNISIGGTVVTDTISLIVLAVVARMTSGVVDTSFWAQFGISFILFVFIVIILFPMMTRWFFRRVSDGVSQFVFVLAMVFFSALLAGIAGLEGILGAFLCGVALNRLIPAFSPLMHRLEFVGNALFIPYFLIGVGMLIDVRAFFQGTETLIASLIVTAVALFAKYLGAWLTQKTYKLKKVERSMIFGLSSAHAAVALATVMIGYEIGLFNEVILNATIVMILVTCTVSSFVVDRASRTLALQNDEPDHLHVSKNFQRILIPIANPLTLENLVQSALLVRNKKSKGVIYGLNVIDDNNEDSKRLTQGRKLLEVAARLTSSVEVELIPVTRYDLNIATGICHTIKERNITDVVMGLHYKSNVVDSFYGPKIERLIKETNVQLFILKCISPINTFQRVVLVIPPKAEYEPGFEKWVDTVAEIVRQLNLSMQVYVSDETLVKVQAYVAEMKYEFPVVYDVLNNWDNFLITSRDIRRSDLFIVVNARYSSVSFVSEMEKLPVLLSKYYANTNIALIYPAQFEIGSETPDSFATPLQTSVVHTRDTLLGVSDLIQKSWIKIKRLFSFKD